MGPRLLSQCLAKAESCEGLNESCMDVGAEGSKRIELPHRAIQCAVPFARRCHSCTLKYEWRLLAKSNVQHVGHKWWPWEWGCGRKHWDAGLPTSGNIPCHIQNYTQELSGLLEKHLGSSRIYIFLPNEALTKVRKPWYWDTAFLPCQLRLFPRCCQTPKPFFTYQLLIICETPLSVLPKYSCLAFFRRFMPKSIFLSDRNISLLFPALLSYNWKRKNYMHLGWIWFLRCKTW